MISATLWPLYKCKFALHFLWLCTVAFELCKMDVPFWLSHKWCQKLQSCKALDYLPRSAFYWKYRWRKSEVLCLHHVIVNTWKPLEFTEQWYHAPDSSNLDQNRLLGRTYLPMFIFQRSSSESELELATSWIYQCWQSCCFIFEFCDTGCFSKSLNFWSQDKYVKLLILIFSQFYRVHLWSMNLKNSKKQSTHY